MIFNQHPELEGEHAFLSPSQYHWTNYDDDKLVQKYSRAMAAARGTDLHDFAQKAITLGRRQPKNKDVLNLYINDAIGFKMTPEVLLYYSDLCFGTADAIGFRKNFLRIHDYKSGVTQTKMRQLEIYAALFCLEYEHNPHDLGGIELRIYQEPEVVVSVPEPNDILEIANVIIDSDKRVNELGLEE